MKYKNPKQRKAVMAHYNRMKSNGYSDNSAKFLALKAEGVSIKKKPRYKRIKEVKLSSFD